MNSTTNEKAPMFQIRDAIYASGLKSSLRFILIALSDHLNSDRADWKVWHSQKKICESTGYGERTVRDGLHELAALGFLSIESKPCNKGRYNIYTVSHQKLGLPAKYTEGPADFSEGPAESADKEQTSKSKEKIEVPTERTTPLASALGKPEINQTTREQGELLAQNFQKRCEFDPKARLRFYMDCGRLHTRADHFHKPKNPDSPLTPSQTDALRLWFEMYPKSGCYVMNLAMANWPQLRAQYNKTHDTKYNRLQTTPTISGLEKAGSGWKCGAEFLYGLWKDSQRKDMIARVEKNVPPPMWDSQGQYIGHQTEAA